MVVIKPSQIRGARAMLGMTQTELAKLAGLSKTGLLNIENGASDPKASTLTAIQTALERAGIEFLEGARPGVRLRK
jgi:DNA-binding XRE family transcriptional regulator